MDLGLTFVPKIWIIPFELRLYFVGLGYFLETHRTIFKLTMIRWRSWSDRARLALDQIHLNYQSPSLNNALRNKNAFSESSISPSGWKNPSWPANKLIPLCLHVVTIPIVSNYKSHHEWKPLKVIQIKNKWTGNGR